MLCCADALPCNVLPWLGNIRQDEAQVFNVVMSEAETGASAASLRACKYLINSLMLTFDLEDIARSIPFGAKLLLLHSFALQSCISKTRQLNYRQEINKVAAGVKG